MNQNQQSLSERTSLCQHGQPVMWVVGIGVVLFVAVFFVIRAWEHKNVEKAFLLAAEERATAVKGAFETEVAMLELVRSSLIADGRVDREEFRETLAPFLSRSNNIKAVEWVPRVPESRREEYEEAARRDGLKDFQFTELDVNGNLTPAETRSEYFPIYFIGPHTGDIAVYGLDVASERRRLESLELARDTGNTVASGRIDLVEGSTTMEGFLVYLPAYEKNKPASNMKDRRENLAGFILGVFRPSEMIASALAKLQPEGIDVGVYDPSDTSGRPFRIHSSRIREGQSSSVDARDLIEKSRIHHTTRLNIGGHPWTIVCAPTREFEAAHRTWWAFAVLVAGLLLTGMVGGYIGSSISHRLHLEERVREQTADIRGAQEEVLFRLTSASQWRDEETGMHIRRTGLLSQTLARANNWFGEDLDIIRQAAPMHDIGKIGIPDAVLQKPGKLTPAEFEVMKTHARIGAEILAGSKVPMLQMAHEIALNHHERWDGKGYPRGLAGKEIPECARIVSIVDVYDALTHDRVYRPALPENEALEILRSGSGMQFDPELLADFMRCLPEIRSIAKRHPDPSIDERPVVTSTTVPPVAIAVLPPDGRLAELPGASV